MTGPRMTEEAWAGVLRLRASLWPGAPALEPGTAAEWYEALKGEDPALVTRGLRACAVGSKWPATLAEMSAAARDVARSDARAKAPRREESTCSRARYEFAMALGREVAYGGVRPPRGEDYERWFVAEVDRRMVARFGVRELPREQWAETKETR